MFGHVTREYLGAFAVFGSEIMVRLLAQVEKVAATNATVLIIGESGSGKEIVARALHHHSLRAAQSWVDINCAALPENLLESELFGYEKGAFSGAHTAKPGLIELAHRGTLFLDEIGDLDLRMQVKLLRVLDGSAYYRVGGLRKVGVDVRMVAATNQNLKAAVAEGRFRSDLYHRLSQIVLTVPPLRERRDDILPLAEHYLAQQRPCLRFTPDACRKLSNYAWPGNVRELRNVVVRAAVLAAGDEIDASDLPEEFHQGAFTRDLHALAMLPEMERTAIQKVLAETGGHQPSAAAKLGISKRTLQRRIKSYGLAAEARV
jgi:transcriptional regulator with PAS, ATPase and Fis domain